MKVVYFIDHLRPDGAQRVLAQLVKGLAGGHQQSVVCLNDSWDQETIEGLRKIVPVRIVGKVALASGYGLISTWHWLSREQFDAAVTFLFASDVIGRTLARVAGIPRIVSSIRARNVNYARWQHWLVRRTMRWADAVVVNSAPLRDYAVRYEGARSNTVRVIPNGVEMRTPEQVDCAQLRRELQVPSTALLVGTAGRLTRQKGFDVLITAMAETELKDVHLLLFGTGEEEGSLKQQTRKLGIGERVHFAGYRKDFGRFLQVLDVYAQPSRFEGMPNALLEAAAAGCPVVASAVDGSCEVIQDGVQGWLVPPEDPAKLSTALHEALENHDEAERRRRAAMDHVIAEFSVGKMVADWEGVLIG